MNNTVREIHNIIRLKKDGYRDIKCPQCNEKPFVERDLKNKSYLTIRCKCGLLNMSERGI